MNTSEIMSAMIFGDGGASNVEELSTDGGASDAGKVLVVGDNGKIAASDLTVGEGEVAIDKTLSVNGAAADAKKVGDALSAVNGSLDTLINVVPTDTASGAVATFSDGADDIPVKNLMVNIEPVQSGTGDSSPDNIRLISGWTGAKITRAGKNLFGGEALRQRLLKLGGNEYASDNNAIVIGAASLGEKVLFSDFKPNTRYTFVITCKKDAGNTSSNLVLKYSNSASNPIYLTEPIADKQKLIVTSVADRTLVSIKGVNSSGGLVVYPDECGIFEGVLTETDFVPYQGNTLDIDWTNEAGTVYGGSLDVTTGLLTVNRKLYTVNAISTVAASYIKSDGVNGYTLNSEIYPSRIPSNMPSGLVADKLKYLQENFWNKAGNTNCFTFNYDQLHIKISNELLGITDYTEETVTTAKEKLNTWLAENPVTLTMPIAETTYQLTAQEVKTILGENNIFADTGDVSVEYRADIKKYIDKVVATAISAFS